MTMNAPSPSRIDDTEEMRLHSVAIPLWMIAGAPALFSAAIAIFIFS